MIYLLFTTALSLSVIAEYYAIMGLMALFSGSPISIAVMGGVLGLAKVVLTSWLYRNWKQTSVLLKSYFVSAISILMLLTSMGIFGFLSKAHLEQGVVSGDVAAKVALIDEKINIQKENINAARKTLSQLDQQVDAALSRTTDAAGADKSTSIRRSQAKERTRLIEEISASQKAIAVLNEEKAPIAIELRKVEAEVGPIKYVAALIYGEDTSQEALEKAVRYVIILIVLVFDPLAILMFVAFNQSTIKSNKESNIVILKQEEKPVVPENIQQMELQDFAAAEDEVNLHLYNQNTGISKIDLNST